MKDTELRTALDRAIDKGDMDEVERLLESTPDVPDMPENFARSIISECKENKNMKKFKISKIGIIAAAVVLSCGAVAGSAYVKHYSAEHNGKYVQVASHEDVEEKELKDIAENSKGISLDDIESGKVYVPDTISYGSIAEAEKAMGMKAVMPQAMPKLKQNTVEGVILNDNRKDMYIVYGDENTQMFGITLGYEKLEDGETSSVVGDIDEGSLGSYTSEKGYKFDTLSETEDGRTANIYTTHIGDYEYSLVFESFSEKEMKSIVDSVNLEDYR